MIDVHSHLLPGIDDGSRSVPQSVATIEQFARDGVTDVVLTPHLDASGVDSYGDDAVEERRETFDLLRPAVPHSPTLHLGFEIMLDRPLPSVAIGDRRFSLAGSRYYLVEFPYGVAPSAGLAVLKQMVQAGVTPIVAHPERYHSCDVAALVAWREAGAKMQLDGTAFTKNGDRARQAREYLEAGVGDLLAADNHGDQRSLATGAGFLRKRGFVEQAEILTVRNPLAVLEDREMEAVPALRFKSGWVKRIRRVLEQE